MKAQINKVAAAAAFGIGLLTLANPASAQYYDQGHYGGHAGHGSYWGRGYGDHWNGGYVRGAYGHGGHGYGRHSYEGHGFYSRYGHGGHGPFENHRYGAHYWGY